MLKVFGRKPLFTVRNARELDYVTKNKLSLRRQPVRKQHSPAATSDSLNYVLVKDNMTEAALDFLDKNFVKNEPFLRTFNIQPCSDLKKLYKEYLEHRRSIAALDGYGEITGILVNVPHKFEPRLKFHDQAVEYIHNDFMKTMERGIDFSTINPTCGPMYECRMLAIKAKWPGKEIARELFDLTELLAIEMKWSALLAHCMSNYSYNHMLTLGFKELKKAKYIDFGLNVDKPHEYYYIMGKRLK